jgi:uncharacterized protein (TIGR03437 family)
MKCICVFFLSAAAVFSADFLTGQAARAVIGQATFTDEDPNSSDTVLGGVSGIAFAADTLFVADANEVGAIYSNHRVLLFRNMSSQLPAPSAVLPPAAGLSAVPQCPVCVGQATVVLGQPDFATTTLNPLATQSSLRLPTAVASDGVHLVIADTDHNRVLIWNRIPATNDAPADVVVGQPNFTSAGVPSNHVPNAQSMSGPQGVWIQNGMLFVADTENNRVLVYNHIPQTNGAAADLVLGQPNFSTYVEVDITEQTNSATAANMLSPVSVTSDGQRLYVSDLGYNRVLIWDTIPTTNGAAANLAVGQPDMVSSIANNGYSVDTTNNNKQTPILCPVTNGTDANSNPTYPAVCSSTLNFPRFALAAAGKLFIADGGNDRVLVFETIPTQSGASADVILGQVGGSVYQATDAADSLRTPMSMAWDGVNLYVSDAYNRRITVYSMGETAIPYSGVRNAASYDIVASGSVTVSGTITAADVATISIGANSSATPANYPYEILATDTATTIMQALVNEINSSNSGAGDPNVVAVADPTTNTVILQSRLDGVAGNSITLSILLSTRATIVLTPSDSTLDGGGDASKLAAGTLVSIVANPGFALAYGEAAADFSQTALPTELAGAQVYVNGIRSPLMYVSPTQINAQIPWEVNTTTSVSVWVRAARSDGSIAVTTPMAATIVAGNPGLFQYPTPVGTPPPGVILHASSRAMGVVSVDSLSPTSGDMVTITIATRSYNYTVQNGDTQQTIRDALVNLINSLDPDVTATAAGLFGRVLLTARVEGPDGNGIPYSAAVGGTSGGSATETLTAFSTYLCCANVAYAPVTLENPALPGEFLIVYATGLGLPVADNNTSALVQTGVQYPLDGPITQPPVLTNALGGGDTVDVLKATLMPGTVGVFEIWIELSPALPADPLTQLWVGQEAYVSNIVRVPVAEPASAGNYRTPHQSGPSRRVPGSTQPARLR